MRRTCVVTQHNSANKEQTAVEFRISIPIAIFSVFLFPKHIPHCEVKVREVGICEVGRVIKHKEKPRSKITGSWAG